MKKRICSYWLGMLVALFLLDAFSLSARTAFPWKAQWINTERCQSATNTWLIYRKSFGVTDVPDQLIARIAADSKYWLWINDQLVIFEGGLKRGPSPSGTYYDPVDIAPYLTKGSNTIAILLWHFGKDGFSHINSGKAALLFEANCSGTGDRSPTRAGSAPCMRPIKIPRPLSRITVCRRVISASMPVKR